MKNDMKEAIAALAYGTQAGIVSLLTPVYFGALARSMNLSTSSLAEVASVEKAAGIAVMLIMAVMIRHLNLKLMGGAAIGLIVAGMIACMFVRDYHVLLAMRLMIGTGGAIAISVQSVYLAATLTPDRWFAWRVTLLVLLTMVGFAALPAVEAKWGITGFYIAMLLPLPFCIASLFFLPAKVIWPETELRQANGKVGVNMPLIVNALMAVACFGAFITPVYDFSERYGNAIGLSPQNIGWVLSTTTGLGLIGSLAASWAATRFGRVKPLAIGTIMAVACVIILWGKYDSTGYFIAMALFSIVWSFNTPYLLGFIAAADSDGRWSLIANAFNELIKLPVLLVFGWAIQTGGLHIGALIGLVFVLLSFVFAAGAGWVYARSVKQV